MALETARAEPSTTWAELPLAWASQIDQMSEEWVAEKELPEMGFTLGGVEELRDPAVRLMLAIDADDRVQAATSWLPTWRDGEVVEEPTDIMAHWRDDLVAFVIGCSFSFEEALMADGLPIRHVERNVRVPMYRTNIACSPAGPFAGPMVVSMRPFRPADAIRAVRIT